MGKEKMKKYKAVFSCGHKGYIFFLQKMTYILIWQKPKKTDFAPLAKKKN